MVERTTWYDWSTHVERVVGGWLGWWNSSHRLYSHARGNFPSFCLQDALKYALTAISTPEKAGVNPTVALYESKLGGK